MKRVNSILSSALMIIFSIISTFSFGQSPKTWEWANSIVGTNKNFPYAMETDKDGNSYIAGGFNDTLKVENKVMISHGPYDIYLIKYNTLGHIVWAKQFGGKDSEEPYGIALDKAGNIYMAGYFSGTTNFSGVVLTSSGDRDFFVAKFDKNGIPVWVKQGGGTLEDFATSVAVDNGGNVFITGIFKGSMTLGNSHYISKGDRDIFLIKYNSNGDILWSATGGGTMADEANAIATDTKGNCYITGDFEGTAEFGKKTIAGLGGKDIFVAKFSADGRIEWLKRGGSATGDDHAAAIAVDTSDNVYVTGYFSGLADFGKTTLKNMGADDIFLVKYDRDGEEIWAKQTGGKGGEQARAMKLDKLGNIYVSGEFNVDFMLGENKIKSIGDWDILIIKYNNSGEISGGTQIGGSGYDRNFGIGLDALSDIYISGYFSKAISIGSTSLKSIDADDGFIAKLKNF